MAAVGCTRAARSTSGRAACRCWTTSAIRSREGEPVYDVTFENVQAGERTSHLFRLANLHDGLVVGTGDLSELALGWCTYGVGDHMSHYNVNASVPKTLIKHLVRWVARRAARSAPATSRCCDDILETEISPELVPGRRRRDAAGAEHRGRRSAPTSCRTSTSTTSLRYGFAPTQGRVPGLHTPGATARAARWPDGARRRSATQYALAEIKAHLRHLPATASSRPASSSARCVPNAPKVGSGGSLSPRGDWRAPSDSEAAVWLAELETVPDA